MKYVLLALCLLLVCPSFSNAQYGGICPPELGTLTPVEFGRQADCMIKKLDPQLVKNGRAKLYYVKFCRATDNVAKYTLCRYTVQGFWHGEIGVDAGGKYIAIYP